MTPPPDPTTPLDPHDPRFVGTDPVGLAAGTRRLVRSQGPGASPEDPKVRILRWVFPAFALAGVVVVAAVFWRGLAPGSGRVVVGPADDVRAAVAERPRRICYGGNAPCAWLTVVGDRLLALSTSGPLAQEFGRQGVGWCPTSGHFGANSSGSRFDQSGQPVDGPAYRGLNRFGVTVNAGGLLTVDFTDVAAGRPSFAVTDPIPPAGPDCEQIPFDRAPDLDLEDLGSPDPG